MPITEGQNQQLKYVMHRIAVSEIKSDETWLNLFLCVSLFSPVQHSFPEQGE